jgi:hypothetical protein
MIVCLSEHCCHALMRFWALSWPDARFDAVMLLVPRLALRGPAGSLNNGNS